MILSTKDLVFKEKLTRKLVDWYIGSYIIDKVVSTNIIKLQLLTLMKIYLIVNVSWVLWYKKQIKEQKIEEVKLAKVDRVKEWEIEKILNKRKIRRVVKYLIWWKRFIVEHNTWEKEKRLRKCKESSSKVWEKA